VPVDQVLLRLAGNLAHEHQLPTLDAVHLAALTTVGEPGSVMLACWDRELRRAAAGLGYELHPADL